MTENGQDPSIGDGRVPAEPGAPLAIPGTSTSAGDSEADRIPGSTELPEQPDGASVLAADREPGAAPAADGAIAGLHHLGGQDTADGSFMQCFAELSSQMTTVRDDLRQLFERKLEHDGFRERQIDKLHAENQEYKRDIVARASRPLVAGMIRMHRDIGKTIDALAAKDPAELTADRLLAALAGVQEDVEVVLSQNGIEAFVEPGDEFNPRRQRALQTVPTADAGLSGRVAASVRPGFEQGDVLIEKQLVAVHKHDPSLGKDAEEAGARAANANRDESAGKDVSEGKGADSAGDGGSK